MATASLIHVGILVLATLLAVLAGWLLRARRCVREKAAISSGWQQQIEAQRAEHGRLVEQNKGLMQQVSQFKARGKDATNRARELSTALKEALERRDVLQREIKDIRSNLETAVARRRQLESDLADRDGDSPEDVLRQKDERIARLGRELGNWQQRLPPLIERFRAKNEEAESLAAELALARERIDALESLLDSDETRVDPVDPRMLGDALNASNDSIEPDAIPQHEAQQARVNDAPVAGLRDDLKRIKGIGPAIEKTLNELGFFRLHQIAEMTDYDIDRVARKLKGFRSRIYREDWTGQARELCDRS